MKNILFIAPTNYTLPINETLKKKFFALSEVCNVRVLAFADISTTTVSYTHLTLPTIVDV